MFGLFKKKEMTEEEAQEKIEKIKAEINAALKDKREKEERYRKAVIDEIKRLLNEADDDIIDAVFNCAAYNYLFCGLNNKMSLLYNKPTLGVCDSNLFTSSMKYMFDLYLNWRNEYDIFLNNCIMKAIKEIRKERKTKNEPTKEETSSS